MVRQAEEQYACPRSQEGQIANGRLQSRQIFWRSGVSTTSERQGVPTGHGGQTVAQERRLARSVGASRRSPRVWRVKLQALTSSTRASAYAVCAVYDNSPRTTTKRPWTLSQPWTHRTRPPLLGNLAAEREIPTSVHSPFLLLQKRRTKNADDRDGRDLRVFRRPLTPHDGQRRTCGTTRRNTLPK